MELDDDEPLACVGIADDDIAEQASLLAEVEEAQTLLDGVVANLVADLVVQVVHQPAFLDRQNLVEGSCDVKTYSWGVF